MYSEILSNALWSLITWSWKLGCQPKPRCNLLQCLVTADLYEPTIEDMVFFPWFWKRCWPIVFSGRGASGPSGDGVDDRWSSGDRVDDRWSSGDGVDDRWSSGDGVDDRWDKACLVSPIIMIPWIWFGITTNSPNWILFAWFFISCHRTLAMIPTFDNSILSSTTRPKKWLRSLVQMVIKYAASHA